MANEHIKAMGEIQIKITRKILHLPDLPILKSKTPPNNDKDIKLLGPSALLSGKQTAAVILTATQQDLVKIRIYVSYDPQAFKVYISMYQ